MNKGVRGIILAILSLGVFIPCLLEASDIDLEEDLQINLQYSHSVVKKSKDKQKKGESADQDISELKAGSGHIKTAHQQVRQKFLQEEEKMKPLGQMAQARHRAMEDAYNKAMDEYLSLIDSLPPNGKATTGQLNAIDACLERILHKKKIPILGSLPYRNLHYPSIQPSQTQPIVPAYKGGNKTLSAEDLESTEEAPITEEIANLAQSLNWNPVSIYEYVKNNIETQWYWGCMKGAEESLRQKSGNDCDQATLFAALLRASGFPTRYVRGTMEFFAGGKDIDIDKIKNLTGIDNPWKMAEFFQKAGIPYSPVITGGKISNFQIEHIWVESEIPYGNYRGAIIDDSEKTWIGLDTSIKIKGYIYNAPQDLFEQSAFISQLPAMRNEYLSAIQTQTPLEYLDNVVLDTTGQAAESYKLTRSLIPDIMNILPASMQFQQRRITNEYTEIPEELKHKVRFIVADPHSPSPEPLFDLQLSTFQLSNKRIALSYEPETVEDQQIIDSYGGLDNTPAYLVKLRPVLKIDGERTVVGKDGLPMGSDCNLTIELISPNGTEKITNTHITGNLAAIGITAQKAISNQLSALSEGDDAEVILFKEANRYVGRWNQAEDELASLLHLNITRPIPTVVTVGGVIDVTYLLDMPHGFEWKGVFVDAGLRAIGVTPSRSPLTQGGDENRHKTFMQLSALQGSILENRIFEDDFQVDSISTAKLFEIVGDQQSALSGQLLTIDKTNINTLIPTLSLEDNIREDITNAVNQGLIVWMPSADSLPLTAVSYKDWTGIGYIKENPATGEAGYMLSGMIAGGMTAVSPNKWLSGDLQNTLAKPYTGNIVTSPIMVNIIFPYDGATLAVSPIDVEGVVSGPVETVKVNGTKALVSGNGRFMAKGVSLSSGVNQITASAATITGTNTSQTISVTYQPSQASPMNISITYPAAGTTINRPTTMVKGTFTSDADEISIKINGMPADIYGNQFVINSLSLVDGDNIIIVNGIDSNGAVGRAEVSVKANTTVPYVTLNANITSGLSPLTSYFMVSTEIPNAVTGYQMDFDGDGVIDYTGETFENMTFTYTPEGVYYPTVTVTDDQRNMYTDSIAIVVLNKETIDALLKGKWEGMKGALLAGNIETALNYFVEPSKDMYRNVFIQMGNDKINSRFSSIFDLRLDILYGKLSECGALRNEDGVVFSYPVTFIKDGDGIWKMMGL